MRAMSEAIEGAAAFTDFRDKLLADERTRVAAVLCAEPADLGAAPLGDARQPGENRAEHRARLKRERRDAKRVKAMP